MSGNAITFAGLKVDGRIILMLKLHKWVRSSVGDIRMVVFNFKDLNILLVLFLLNFSYYRKLICN